MRRFTIAEQGFPYFLTSAVVLWIPCFTQPETCDIIINSLDYCRQNKGLRVHAYVIMPTHLHLILSCEGDLRTILREFKSWTSRQLVNHYAANRNPPFGNVFRFCGKNSRRPVVNKVLEEGNHSAGLRFAI